MEGVVNCMLVAMSLLALIGLRYPVKMMPLLLFETAWKLTWLTVVALPLRIGGPLDHANLNMTIDLLYVVIIIAVIPWRYVADHAQETSPVLIVEVPHPEAVVQRSGWRVPVVTRRSSWARAWWSRSR
jgi:hypothetical protein